MSVQYWRCMVCWEMNAATFLFRAYIPNIPMRCKRPECGGVCEAVKL